MDKQYSGKQVIKAGDHFLDDDIFEDENAESFQWAMEVLSYWRFTHEAPLNVANDNLLLDSKKIDKSVVVAKRLKRHISIVRKLRRFEHEKMKLRTMQDIGGARAIFSSLKKLRTTQKILLKRAEFKQEDKSYKINDYIKTPKIDGYRGVHLIGKFERSGVERKIEVQLRTRIQHYWATALEIIDLFTGQALKSNNGEITWEAFFIRVSEQFSLMEDIHVFETLTSLDQIKKYKLSLSKNKEMLQSCKDAQWLCSKLNVIKSLEAYSNSLNILDEQLQNKRFDGYVLLEIDIKTLVLSTNLFPNEKIKEAELAYIDAEKGAANNPHHIVALISSTALGGIKEAYPNYFADSSKFLYYLSVIQGETINMDILDRVQIEKLNMKAFY